MISVLKTFFFFRFSKRNLKFFPTCNFFVNWQISANAGVLLTVEYWSITKKEMFSFLFFFIFVAFMYLNEASCMPFFFFFFFSIISYLANIAIHAHIDDLFFFFLSSPILVIFFFSILHPLRYPFAITTSPLHTERKCLYLIWIGGVIKV